MRKENLSIINFTWKEDFTRMFVNVRIFTNLSKMKTIVTTENTSS